MITVHGLSSVTLGKVRSLYAAKFLAHDTSAPAFANMVNEVAERFHMDSDWKGSTAVFEFSVSEVGSVTLPLFLDSVLQAQFNDSPRPTMHNRYEFLTHGVGQVDATISGLGVLIDQGNVGIATEFPNTPAVLSVASSAADDGKEVRILGLDENGVEIYDDDGVPGELVTLAAPTVATIKQFSNILGIQKPATSFPVVVSVGSTELADIPPGVTNPVYRRYKVAQSSGVGKTDYVRAVCSRQLIPVANEEDYIVPGNLSALKLGLYSIVYEESNDLERAEQYWAKSIELLNKDMEKHRGGAIPLATFSPSGFGIGKTRGMR